MEIRAKTGGPVLQSIMIGESQTIACDLDRESLPAKWIGALDYNADGFQDIYLQVAQGSSPSLRGAALRAERETIHGEQGAR